MVVKVIMPTAHMDLIPKIKEHVNRKADIISLYKTLLPEEIDRQTTIFIANSAPKVITPNASAVYVLVVKHPVLMAMVASRVNERMRKLFSHRKRQWYLLDWNPKTKCFEEYFLP